MLSEASGWINHNNLYTPSSFLSPTKEVQQMSTRKIYLGSDHAGFQLKQKIKQWLDKKKVPYQDLGDFALDTTDDYPDFAEKVALAAVKNKTFGILICGTGFGMCIAANKIRGARAVYIEDLKEARLAREHNDANILCLSGWHAHFHKSVKLIEKFITTPFSKHPRHIRRLNKIKELDLHH